MLLLGMHLSTSEWAPSLSHPNPNLYRVITLTGAIIYPPAEK